MTGSSLIQFEITGIGSESVRRPLLGMKSLNENFMTKNEKGKREHQMQVQYVTYDILVMIMS